MRTLTIFLAATFALPSAFATPVLWSIGGDSLGVPRNLVQFDAGTQTISVPIQLGNGSTGFTGGLAWSGAEFLGFELDGLGNANLVSIALSGSVTNLFSAGAFSYGGLTYLGNQLYGIRTNGFGDAELVAMDLGAQAMNVIPIAGVPQGWYGGLSAGMAADRLYTIQNDSFGGSTLYEVNLAQGTASPLPIALGSGFTGGLAFAGGQFYAVASDIAAASTVYRFQLNDLTPTSQFALGDGFRNSALAAAGPAPSSVPEPGTVALVAAGLVLLVLRRR